MNFSFWLDTITLEWSIVYIKGSQVIFISIFENRFASANSVDPDEVPRFTAFHLGLHCLSKYAIRTESLV